MGTEATSMEELEDRGEDRAIGGWLTLAVLAALLLPWQSTTSSAACGSGANCGWVSGVNSVYVAAFNAGPRSLAFWGWTVFLAVAMVALATFQIDRRYPLAPIPFRGLIGPRFYRAAGGMLLMAALAASVTSSRTSPVDVGGGSATVTFTTGPSVWLGVAIVASLAICRGGYLFKGIHGYSHGLKRLLFDPYSTGEAA
jgi:hypothetical protein